MAALRAILTALALAVRRELGGFRSIQVNNFFLLIALMVYGAAQSGVWPAAAEAPIALMGLLLLFPLSSDPLALVPESRLALFPLSERQRFLLRLLSLALSPVFWIALAVLVATRRFASAGLILVFAVGIRLVPRVLPRWQPLRLVPRLPGRLGGIIRHSLRQILMTLDFYAALVFSFGACCYRWFDRTADPAAFPVIAIFIGVALSTYAQCLFGMDRTGSSAMTRYQLLPLRGWQILLAKGIAFFAVLLVLVLPLDAMAGATFGLTALAIGHHPSVFIHEPLHPWRFAGSRALPAVVQAVVSVMVAFGEVQHGPLFLLGAAIVYVGSLAIYGRLLESRGSV